MDSLKHVHSTIDSLQKDLSAEIVIREEEIIYGTGLDPSGGGISVDRGYVETETVIPKWAIPDTKKIEAARKELNTIYETTPWKSARYEAGVLSGIDHEVLRSELHQWLEELHDERQRHSLTGDERGDVAKIFNGKYCGPDMIKQAGSLLNIEEADILGRLIVHCNINQLRLVYNKSTNPIYRKDAGYLLGYSNFRIWFHEFIR